MLLRRKLLRQNTQAARHSQMDDDPTVRQLQQQVFGPALHAENRLIAQGVDLSGYRPAQATVAYDSMQNGLTHQMRLNTPAAGLYLR
ncbi:hypothetical protein D3C79_1004720 [compost metagenome]